MILAVQIDEQNIFANIELVSELFRGDPGESELTEEAIWGAAVAVDSGNPKKPNLRRSREGDPSQQRSTALRPRRCHKFRRGGSTRRNESSC
jgi:hypothetical protein